MLATVLLPGCAGHRENLPTYEPAPADVTWHALREQAAADLTATGEITLWGERGRATLKCAIAGSGPGNFRLRAWKLDQAALDITLTDGQVWVYAPRTEDEDLQNIRAADMARAWLLLSGAIFEDAAPRAEAQDGVFAYTNADGLRITADRATRTARRFEIAELDPPLTLDLDRFELIDGRPWPTRLDLRAGERRARLRLDTIEFVAPPPGAFTPPRRATRVERP